MENGDGETLGHDGPSDDTQLHESSSVPLTSSGVIGDDGGGERSALNGNSGSDSDVDDDGRDTAPDKKSANSEGIGAKLKLSKLRRKRKHNKLEYAPLQAQDSALIDNDLLLPAAPITSLEQHDHHDEAAAVAYASNSMTSTSTSTSTSLPSSSSPSTIRHDDESEVVVHPLERSGEWKNSTLPVFVKRAGPPLPPPPAPTMMALSDETPSQLDEYNRDDDYDGPFKPPKAQDSSISIDLSVEEQELAQVNAMAAQQAELKQQRRDLIRGVILCCISLFLWASAWSIHTINVQELVAKLVGSSEDAALYFGAIDGSTSIMQLLGSPLIGVLADRFGRKPLLSFSLVGLLAYSTLAIGACFTEDLNVGFALLFVGSLVTGATAGERIMYSAIVSDLTTPQERPRFFGLLGLALGSGFVIGALLGYLLSGLQLYQIFIITTSAFGINALIIIVFLKETLPLESRIASIPWSKVNPVGSVRFYLRKQQPVSPIARTDVAPTPETPSRLGLDEGDNLPSSLTESNSTIKIATEEGERNPYLIGLVPVLFFHLLTLSLFFSAFMYFANLQYGWERKQVFMFLFVVGISVAAAQGLSGVIFKYLAAPSVLLVGIAFRLVADPCFAFSTKGWQAYFLALLVAISSLQTVSIGALMSSMVGPKNQGELFGANACIDTAAVAIGKYVFNSVLSASSKYLDFPGAMFLLSMCFVAFNFVMASVLNYKYKSYAPLGGGGSGAALPAQVISKDEIPGASEIEIEMETVVVINDQDPSLVVR